MAYQEIIFSPPDLMQAALTKVNENFTELYANRVTNQQTIVGNDPVTPTEFTVDNTTEFYFINCDVNSVTANFDLNTFGKRSITFIRLDNFTHKFYINDLSGTFTVSGEPVPFDCTPYFTLNVVSNGTNLFIF